MNVPVWRVDDDGEAQLSLSPAAEAGLVSLPFLGAALRRKWRRVVATAGICALLALGLTQVLGGQHTASVTLLLTTDPTADPSAAMSTNLSLLRTRTVSQEVVQSLHLPLTPEAFQATVTGGQLSDQLMTVAVTAPSVSEALTRANALAAVFLDYRARQMSALADSTVSAIQQRVGALKDQIAVLTKRYDEASPRPGQEELATALLTQRAQLQLQVDSATQEIGQTRLQNDAIVHASHVVDDAAIVEKSRLKAAALAVMSGLVGGAALGLGWVLVPAILSTRLRRRDEIARAIGLSVRFSAGRVRGRCRWITGSQDRRNAERLAHGLATALPDDGDSARLTVATIGDVRDGAYVVGALADELASESTRVAVVDLSTTGALARTPRLRFGRRDPLRHRQLVEVHRRDVRVSLLTARSRVGLSSHQDLTKAEVILTLIELDLGVGLDVLGDLADASVVLVGAGCASAERLRSSAALLRQAAIRPAFAMVVGADDTDESSGLLEPFGPRETSSRRSS